MVLGETVMKKIEFLGLSRLKVGFYALLIIAAVVCLWVFKPKQVKGVHVEGKRSLVLAGLSVFVATEFATTAFPTLHPHGG